MAGLVFMRRALPLIAVLATTVPACKAAAQQATIQIFGSASLPTPDQASGDPADGAQVFVLHEPGRSATHMLATVDEKTPDGMRKIPVTLLSSRVTTPCPGLAAAPPRLLATRVLTARRAFWPAIAAAECRFGLPPGLMDSIVLAESHYDPSIVSRAGAAGLAQLMPATARQLGVLDRFDPSANVQAGARYLRGLIRDFAGDIPLALAAYNAGPLAVRRARGIPANGETPSYVERVLGYWTAPGIGPMSPAVSARQTAQMLGFAPATAN